MTKEDFFKSKTAKFAFPIIVIGAIIQIFQGGYIVGNWLYHLSH
jgi:hypothetical protein